MVQTCKWKKYQTKLTEVELLGANSIVEAIDNIMNRLKSQHKSYTFMMSYILYIWIEIYCGWQNTFTKFSVKDVMYFDSKIKA